MNIDVYISLIDNFLLHSNKEELNFPHYECENKRAVQAYKEVELHKN